MKLPFKSKSSFGRHMKLNYNLHMNEHCLLDDALPEMCSIVFQDG